MYEFTTSKINVPKVKSTLSLLYKDQNLLSCNDTHRRGGCSWSSNHSGESAMTKKG
jgi:hypothetical protein